MSADSSHGASPPSPRRGKNNPFVQPENDEPKDGQDEAEDQPLIAPQQPEAPWSVEVTLLLSWFTMGLINNVVYVVYIAASEDILEGWSGAILLASIAPSLLVKLSLPLFQHKLPYLGRMLFVVTGEMCSLVLTATAKSDAVKVAGVALNSFAGGVGEVTLLGFSSLFPPFYFTAWATGTGSAGIVGAGVYITLRYINGLDSENSLMVLTPVPLLLLGAFLVLYRRAKMLGKFAKQSSAAAANPISTAERVRFIPSLFKYMGPLFLVYLSEYSINQGVASAYLSKHNYVLWQFCYQIGVFVSRASISCFRIKYILVLALLQLANFCFLLNVMPRLDVHVDLPFAFYEGLLGGTVYVNAFYRVATEHDAKWREFAMAITSVADTCGISFAAVISMGLESYLRPIAPE